MQNVTQLFFMGTSLGSLTDKEVSRALCEMKVWLARSQAQKALYDSNNKYMNPTLSEKQNRILPLGWQWLVTGVVPSKVQYRFRHNKLHLLEKQTCAHFPLAELSGEEGVLKGKAAFQHRHRWWVGGWWACCCLRVAICVNGNESCH